MQAAPLHLEQTYAVQVSRSCLCRPFSSNAVLQCHERCVGYVGDRCSKCAPYNPDFDKESCDDSVDPPRVNGYYRLESQCHPCPCTWVQFWHMILAVFMAATAALTALDQIEADLGEHASTLAAPMFIVTTFVQSIATFLDTGIPWPASIRALMVMYSSINFNLELTVSASFLPCVITWSNTVVSQTVCRDQIAPVRPASTINLKCI